MSKERKTEVKTFKLQLFCDCGGEMLPTGMCLTSHPVQYPHECQVCKKTENIFRNRYPCLVYEEKP